MRRVLRAFLVAVGLFWLLLPVTKAAPVASVYERWFPKMDPAIERGLRYLQSQERAGGGFDGGWYGRSCGISGLVGMSYLAKGYLPTEGPYAESLQRIIRYLLKDQHRSGLFDAGEGGQGPMYGHTIATLFLSEVSGMVDRKLQEQISPALARATHLILRAQAVKKGPRHQGGWRYHPGSRDSDTSCSGWALLALQSARLNGAAVPEEALEQAVAYLLKNFSSEEGHFGYASIGSHKETLTGMGLLCLELNGWHGRAETRKAGDFILANLEKMPGREFEVYGNYYNAQATFQLGDAWWGTYADWMYAHYLKEQREDGAWFGKEAGPVYGTAMMVLAFTVPYRQLPIYQREGDRRARGLVVEEKTGE